MEERKRPPSFQFYPADYLSDSAVEQMTLEAQGAYVRLLCHAWMQAEPGVLPDDDAALASLSRLNDRWSACAVSIRRAFNQTSREGRQVMVQRRMVGERMEQEKRYQQAKEGARVTNEKRWGSVAQRRDSERTATRTAVTPSSSSSSESTSKHSAHPADEREGVLQLENGNGHPAPDPDHLSVEQWFSEVFWKKYPRKVGKKAAWRVVNRMFRHLTPAQEDVLGDSILDLLRERVRGEWFGREQDKIPHASTFLNAEDFGATQRA